MPTKGLEIRVRGGIPTKGYGLRFYDDKALKPKVLKP
jgi:hypothetical protein